MSINLFWLNLASGYASTIRKSKQLKFISNSSSLSHILQKNIFNKPLAYQHVTPLRNYHAQKASLLKTGNVSFLANNSIKERVYCIMPFTSLTCYNEEKLKNENSKINRFLLPIVSFFLTLILVIIKTKYVQCENCSKKKSKNMLHQEEFENKEISDHISSRVQNSINLSTKIIDRYLEVTGAPGLSVAVSIGGQTVWTKGFGLQDIENEIAMSKDSVLRIASISKPITMTGVALLVEAGLLDLDAPVQDYVEDFPKKYFNGQEVTITTRHLLSHVSGIRHYRIAKNDENNMNIIDKKEIPPITNQSLNKEKVADKKAEIPPTTNQSLNKKKVADKEAEIPPTTNQRSNKQKAADKREEIQQLLSKKLFYESQKNRPDKYNEYLSEEYYIKEYFESVDEALKLFQDDDLLHKPEKSKMILPCPKSIKVQSENVNILG